MSEYHKIEGVKIAGFEIYVKEPKAIDKVGIALRDAMIEKLKASGVYNVCEGCVKE